MEVLAQEGMRYSLRSCPWSLLALSLVAQQSSMPRLDLVPRDLSWRFKAPGMCCFPRLRHARVFPSPPQRAEPHRIPASLIITLTFVLALGINDLLKRTKAEEGDQE